MGMCYFVLDNLLPIAIHSTSASPDIKIIAQVQPQLPDHPPRHWLENSLKAALNPLIGEEPGLGWHAEMGLVAFVRLDPQRNEEGLLESTLARLVQWVERWHEDNCYQ